MEGGAWQATVHGVARVGHDLATKPPPPNGMLILMDIKITDSYDEILLETETVNQELEYSKS